MSTMANDKPERILHCVIGSMNVGGIETMLMELYRNIDRNRYQFDFVVHDYKKNTYEDEIRSLGGRLYRVPYVSKKPIKHNMEFRKILLEHPEYRIIHIHTTYSIMYGDARIAKELGRTVVIHSHNSNASKKRAIVHAILKKKFSAIADYRLSCSNIAAKWMFDKKDLSTVQIWKNAIKIEQFKYDVNIREKVRKAYNADGDIILGCVGRLSYQKNQDLMLRIFAVLAKKRLDIQLWLVGDGEDRASLEAKARELGITPRVHFFGSRSDVNELMMGMDIMALTSRWEGLSVVLIEAQATGLPIVVPNFTDEMTRILPSAAVIEKYEDTEEWADAVLNCPSCTDEERSRAYELVAGAGFDIVSQVKTAEKFYAGVIGDREE